MFSRFLLGALVLCAGIMLFNTQADAGNATPRISKTIVIEASADEVWERLRKLDGLEEIIPQYVAHSSINTSKPQEGTQRTCKTPDGKGFYKEQVINFSDADRHYSYTLVDGTIPLTNMLASFRVVDLGYKKCMVVWQSNFEWLPNEQMPEAQLEGFLSQAGSDILAGLKRLHGKS